MYICQGLKLKSIWKLLIVEETVGYKQFIVSTSYSEGVLLGEHTLTCSVCKPACTSKMCLAVFLMKFKPLIQWTVQITKYIHAYESYVLWCFELSDKMSSFEIYGRYLFWWFIAV